MGVNAKNYKTRLKAMTEKGMPKKDAMNDE
jgi:hypothetical protein